jgi:integrase
LGIHVDFFAIFRKAKTLAEINIHVDGQRSVWVRGSDTSRLYKFSKATFLAGVWKDRTTVETLNIGTVAVKVYATPSKKQGQSYPGFTGSFNFDGQRFRLWSSTAEALERKVREAIRPLIGESDTLTLSGAKLREFERAMQITKEMGLDLDGAAQALRAIQRSASAKSCSVEQALDYWARHHDRSKFNSPVASVVAAFFEDCTRNGNSREDIDTMRGKLRRFSESFKRPLSEISAEDYRVYFKTVPGCPRSRLNHRNTIRRLVNWAKGNGFLAHDHPGLPRFAGRVKIPPKQVEVFDVSQREKLIEQARLVELPMTLINAFTPIRQKEVGVAVWENVDLDFGLMMVRGEDAKKRVPRAIHLPRVLVERLRPLAKPSGRIYPLNSFYKVGPRLARKAGLRWIRNGWRATTISHLQAAVNDLARVAEAAGTSASKIKSNYLKLLRPDIGRAYFGLRLGERHPIEPGYDADRYGSRTVVSPEESRDAPNIVPVEFGSRCAS